MKRLLNKLSFILIVIFILPVFNSCTDLDEDVYSSIVPENFYKTEDELIAAMVPAYSDLCWMIRNRGVPDCEAYTSDIMIIPTRDYGGWYDGGRYQQLFEHTWTSENSCMDNMWSRTFNWVDKANMLIYQFSQVDNMDPDLKTKFTSELSIIRAFAYYNLLNTFGNVPIVDRFDVPEGFTPKNNTDFEAGRKEVFEFIEKDLLDNIPNLTETVDESTSGRFNKYAAMMILVKLYMNAEVWTGIPRWDDAITYADKIINSGNYQLEADYFANFKVENKDSKENIFVLPFNATISSLGWAYTSYLYRMHHHFLSAGIFGVSLGGQNGPAALPSFIHSFDSQDIRLKGWSIGLQLNKSTGDTIFCNKTYSGKPLNYTIDYVDIYDPTDETVYDYKNAPEYAGARFSKYEIAFADGTNMSNDYVVYRYADVLLLKAEALMRKHGGMATEEAVNLVNQIHKRAFEDPSLHLYTTNTFTMEELLAERARELYYEGMRRNDLIRFDKFAQGEWEKEWYDRSSQGDEKNWYPIPQTQMNANISLTQNPGY